MYDNRLFSQGVRGALTGKWTLVCETPLVIRNGTQVSYSSEEGTKTRNRNVKFAWREKDKDNKKECEVANLNYGYRIKNGKVIRYHFVPPSSVRGALRSWTIRHLVQEEYHRGMTPPKKEMKKETDEYIETAKKALENPASGYPLIASLFGLASDTRKEEGIEGNAGRLRLETEAFSTDTPRPISIDGSILPGEEGPVNAPLEMIVRNPLDRMTHASKEGGLHHFLEFCQGTRFVVNFTILNPQKSDLGLVNLWVGEMEAGFLRVGALSSIGRGRVRVEESEYRLWQVKGMQAWPNFLEESLLPEDALSDIWQASRLQASGISLPDYEKALLEAIGGEHAST